MAGCSLAYGQTYPIKPIRIIAAATVGGSDCISRLIAPGLTEPETMKSDMAR